MPRSCQRLAGTADLRPAEPQAWLLFGAARLSLPAARPPQPGAMTSSGFSGSFSHQPEVVQRAPRDLGPRQSMAVPTY